MEISPGQTSLILASGSPRRRRYLRELGLSFCARAPDVGEEPRPRERAERYVRRVALAKALAVSTGRPGAWVLAADTAVVLSGRILGKPRSEPEARRMLRMLSGARHEVLTAVCLVRREGTQTRKWTRVVRSRVTFRRIDRYEIAWYVRSREPMDKAGAYAVQGKAAMFISSVEGSVSNVVGLPLAETVALLRRAGVPLPWRGPK